jgi:RNA polymerase sigma-70 factor (ECF subfamily)
MMSVEGRPLNDTSLIEAAKSGDTRAYGELVQAHQQVALRVAYLVLRDPVEAEDVVQEAFVKAYRALNRVDAERGFRPWLLAIVRNEALNRGRSRSRRRNLELRLEGEGSSRDSARSPEALALEAAAHREVLAAVDALPERQRLVVGLRFLAGLSEAETASTLGIPVGTVKSRSARALDRLRTDLETTWIESEETT